MKTFLIAILTLVSVYTAQAAEPFRGTLTFNVSGPEARELKTLSLVGNGKLMRLDVLMQENTISVIRDPETKVLTMMVPQRKMAMTISETKGMGNIGIGGEESGEPTVTVSTEVVKILGYDTHLETLVFPNGNKVQAWISDELGVFSIPDAFAGAMKKWVNKKAVPLRVVKWVNGAETVRLEATAATTDMPAPSLFVVPADFQTVAMPTK